MKKAGNRSVSDFCSAIVCLSLKISCKAMSPDFVINALESESFSKYFEMSNAELNSIGAYLFTADKCPCYPCRVSLEDAKVGETVLAITYEHHSVAGAYRSCGPIFVRKKAASALTNKNSIPDMLVHRTLSVRGYNNESLMIEADIIAGKDLEATLASQFLNDSVDYIHIHNAGPGCFNCSVTRV